MCLVGFALRLQPAMQNYLNPDEAMHVLGALAPNWLERISRLHHPPSLFVLLRAAGALSESEWMLRLLPVLAGSLFPLIVYRWMAKAFDRAAAFTALALLVFSPNLIALSAQVRGYTIALLFGAAAILLLDRAFREDSLRALGGSTVCLYIAILTEYSAAWLAGGLGVYFIVLAWQTRPRLRFVALWAAGQAGAVAIYFWLTRTFVARLAETDARERVLNAYLSSALPSRGENPVHFAVIGTLKQFAYAMCSVPLGLVLALLFVVGLILLWLGIGCGRKQDGRAFVLATFAALGLACIGALVRMYPYGRTRHTVILFLFLVPVSSVAAAWLTRRWRRAALALVAVLVIAWPYMAVADPFNIAPSRHAKTSMLRAIAELRGTSSQPRVLLTDRQTVFILAVYIPEMSGAYPTGNARRSDRIGTMRLFHTRWDLGGVNEFLKEVEYVRKVTDVSEVWVLDSGFDIKISSQLRSAGYGLAEYRTFGGAAELFLAP